MSLSKSFALAALILCGGCSSNNKNNNNNNIPIDGETVMTLSIARDIAQAKLDSVHRMNRDYNSHPEAAYPKIAQQVRDEFKDSNKNITIGFEQTECRTSSTGSKARVVVTTIDKSGEVAIAYGDGPCTSDYERTPHFICLSCR
jgi:hypothetical protein